MAAVLDALAPYVKKLITDMAQEEVSMLLGVSGEITKLEDNMEGIKAFLADAERRRLTDKSVQRWVRKLKGAMYDATDIIDLCQLEADKRREAKKSGGTEEKPLGCCQSLLFCLRNPVFAHEIGSQIKELNQRLDGIHREADKFKFSINNLGSNLPEPRMITDVQRSMQKMTSEFDESAIVGEKIEQDTRELSQLLITGGDHNVKVVSIMGTGGMGKTTLAQKVFNETTVQEHFKVKVWLSITQNFDEAEMLRTAIKHAGGHHGDEHDKTLLTRTLTNTLSTGRFLFVLDDVWSDHVWTHVLSVPVRNSSKKQPGSWVLITTRFGDLALRMGASFYQHQVNSLDVEDAWSLLKKQLPPHQVVGIDDRLKDIGTEILKKCEGLPLAIKVVGGLLSTRYASEREWNAVLSSPAWSVAGLPEQLDNRIFLSYEDLSPQLKQCFLYCSLFPKGEVIIQDVVTHMWISEGFIQPPDDGSSWHEYELEEMATEYHRELIKRNLIEPTKQHSLTGYLCTMHDVVRSFAEYMAREESAVVVDDKQVATCGGGMLVRRLSVGQTVSAVEWTTLQRMKSLRTLIIRSSIKFQSGGDSLLGSFSSLRVLYVRYADSDRLVASLSNLKHLRYLHLELTDVSRLPDDIQQMKFLQFINLLHCEKLDHLPSSMIKLVHLRSLNIIASNLSVVPKGFGGLTNLRSLYGFPVHVDNMDHAGGGSWCSLQELAPLSQLRELTLHGLEKVPASWMAEKAMISSKGHLSYLELNYSSVGGGEIEQQQSVTQEDVLEKLYPPTSSLETLTVEGGYAGRQLPSWMHAPTSAADFKSLRFLSLENLPCCTRLPEGFCCLPCLEGLSIEDAPAVKRIGPEFQAPSSSLPAGGYTAAALAPPPFPKLRELQLKGLCEWEEWEWNDDQGCEAEQQGNTMAMPCLEQLTIKNCKLSCLPPGLANSKRRSLRWLNLYKMTNLTAVENFPSVVELDVFDCPKLKRISGLSRLHKIRIVRCPKLEVLEGVPSLDNLVLEDATMEALPGYLQAVHPRYLEVDCSKKLRESLLSPGSFEWSKISHIGKRNIIDLED